MFRPRVAGCLLAVGMVAVFAGPAVEQVEAVPTLQVYIEGATYNNSTESWTLSPADASGGSFRLWTIGNVAGDGGNGTIFDVRAVFSYDASYGQLDINMAASTTGGYGGFADPSTPGAPLFVQYSDAGDIPVMADGKNLPGHGVFGSGIAWQEFALGNFDQTDSPITDFQDSFPAAPSDTTGQINVYEVSVTGPFGSEGVQLHVDLFGYTQGNGKSGIKAWFAPPSHDGDGYIGDDDGDVTPVPVPASAWMGIAMLGCLAGGAGLRRFRQQQAA